MEDAPTGPPLRHDLNIRTTSDGYEVWFSNRIAQEHAVLVDQCADWLEDEVGAVNLGQIDHRALLADGILSDQLRREIVDWWTARLGDLDPG